MENHSAEKLRLVWKHRLCGLKLVQILITCRRVEPHKGDTLIGIEKNLFKDTETTKGS